MYLLVLQWDLMIWDGRFLDLRLGLMGSRQYSEAVMVEDIVGFIEVASGSVEVESG